MEGEYPGCGFLLFLLYSIPAETTGRQAYKGGPNFGLSDHKPSSTLRRELSANPSPFRPVRLQSTKSFLWAPKRGHWEGVVVGKLYQGGTHGQVESWSSDYRILLGQVESVCRHNSHWYGSHHAGRALHDSRQRYAMDHCRVQKPYQAMPASI